MVLAAEADATDVAHLFPPFVSVARAGEPELSRKYLLVVFFGDR